MKEALGIKLLLKKQSFKIISFFSVNTENENSKKKIVSAIGDITLFYNWLQSYIIHTFNNEKVHIY